LTFNSAGYPLKFIQRRRCRDASAHLFTLIYKFHSPITRYAYIVHADYHEEDVFAIKFYAQKDSKDDYKYSRITNKGDVFSILISCLQVVPLLLPDYPTASFGFIGSRTVDRISGTVEDYQNTQRFRIYCGIVESTIGEQTFAHFSYQEISGYLLVNRLADTLEEREQIITRMFTNTYNGLLDV
jgi:hypothetical protein